MTSRTYTSHNNNWQPSNNTYDQQRLQLESEFGLYVTNDRQTQSQQPSPTYTAPFQLSQPSLSSSSSLQGVFGNSTQQNHLQNHPGQPSTTVGSATPTQNVYLHGTYNNNQPLPFNPMNSGTYVNDPPPTQYPNGVLQPNGQHITTSPLPMQEHFSGPSGPQPNYYRPTTMAGGRSAPQHKRQRLPDNHGDEDPDSPEKEGIKRPAGACTRCKALKVRCEFITETDICKRCLNGGHDCTIPGRKKRRVPPKREHLLAQIRQQAEQIAKLMAQLEQTQRSQGQLPNLETSPSTIISSPILTSAAPNTGSMLNGATTPPVTGIDIHANKAIEDWISKAKESFMQFGNSIGIGTADLPKSYLDRGGEESDEYSEGEDAVETDPEESPGFDGAGGRDHHHHHHHHHHQADRYGIAIEHADGEVGHDLLGNPGSGSGGRLRNQLSNSSLNTTSGVSVAGSAVSSSTKKRGSGDKPANLPVEAAPFELFEHLSLLEHKANNGEPEEDAGPGIVNPEFFKSKPPPDTLAQRLNNIHRNEPHILTRGIITPAEAEKLFKIYFEKMNDSLSLLDPKLYEARMTFMRSPFLFTVICAIASRFFSERPDLYPQLMHYAQLAAGTALISGNKNVDMCAAYILLSLYPVPTRRLADQRSWLYLGLAIRTATDLNLHIPIKEKPRNEYEAREMLNRTRIWLNCYNLDRSTGSQYGKPPIISNTDYLANHSGDWWHSSPYNMQHFDIHICAYNAELRVMAKFMAKIYNDPDHPTGLNKNADFEALSTATDDELKALGDQWFQLLETTDLSVPQNRFRTGLLHLAYSYSRLIALSYGFQHAFGKNNTDENPFLNRCLNAARDVVNAVLNDVCRPEQLFYWRHGPEAQSIFVTFASAFLVKLLQPKFASHLSPETRIEIRGLVQKVVDLLSSPEIAVDDQHGPKLYARFLRNLLNSPILRYEASQRRSRLPKSQRETPEPSETANAIPLSNETSPAHSGGSLSPPPVSQEMTSFDMFAPIGVGATDPYFQGLDTTSNTALGLTYMSPGTGAGLGLDGNGRMDGVTTGMGDMFQPPLNGDQLIMQNMESLGNANPLSWRSDDGYAWFPQFQQNMQLFTQGGYAQ